MSAPTTYDKRGNVLTYTATQMALDDCNNLVQIEVSWTFTYNENNKILSFNRSDGFSGTYSYDENGYQSTFNDASGYAYEYTNDARGNHLTFKNNNGISWERTYDENNNELTYVNNEGLHRIREIVVSFN